jgi:hypothetical protein
MVYNLIARGIYLQNTSATLAATHNGSARRTEKYMSDLRQPGRVGAGAGGGGGGGEKLRHIPAEIPHLANRHFLFIYFTNNGTAVRSSVFEGNKKLF